MIRQVSIDLFDSYARVIAHQVNCMGVMGSGVALQVKKRYPEAYRLYKDYCDANKNNRISMLGTVQFCPVSLNPDGTPRIYVANLFAQYDYGWDKRVYTNYDAFRNCMQALARFALPNNYIVAMPYKIGCARGGGDWDGRVLPIIKETLDSVNVLICKRL